MDTNSGPSTAPERVPPIHHRQHVPASPRDDPRQQHQAASTPPHSSTGPSQLPPASHRRSHSGHEQPQPAGLLPALSPAPVTATPRRSSVGQQQQQNTTPRPRVDPRMQHPPMGSPRGAPGPPRGGRQPTPQRPGAGAGAGPQGQGNVFQAVMGARPGQVPQDDVGGAGTVKVYASAYSQIPVFEAMIRNISVMRRMADGWVNATQILKVAGISKSVRTKILEKQVQTHVHEKVQGGYGKYQGTWIPLDRGRALAEQYGVMQLLAPIFDFNPPAAGPPALPMRGGSGTPKAKASAAKPGAASAMSPFARSGPAPPPQFVQQQQQQQQQHESMGPGPGPHYSAPPQQHMQGPPMFYQSSQPQPPPPGSHPPQGPPQMPHQQPPHHQPPGSHMHMRYPPDRPPRSLEPSAPIDMGPGGPSPGLAPPANINGHGGHQGPMQGLPPPPNDVYVDQFGHPHGIGPSPYGEDRPAKRARVDKSATPLGGPQEGITPEAGPEEAEEEEDDDDVADRPPLPASFRLSSKPYKPRLSSQSQRHRSQLLSLFDSETVDVRSAFALGPNEKPDWDVDMVIDEQGHTALHWACALGRMSVVAQLIELGADIHRGNYSGDTPLIRSVLSTNHAEAGTFSQLLEQYLGPSIRTLDHSYASVIHHIALSASLKGRAACARGYMASVLEWIAHEAAKEKASVSTPAATQGQTPSGAAASPAPPSSHSISLKRLVDLQDLRGDTALNVAARIGSKPLVNLLLDAGADKARANKLGLRPVDFGVEVDALTVSSKEDAISGLKTEVKRPERRSADVLKNISALFDDINRTFDNEMEKHVKALGEVEQNVRTATRSLADRRQQVEIARRRVSTLEQQAERVENARRALDTPEADWTGRMPLKSEKALPPMFEMVPPPAPSADASAAPPPDMALPEPGAEGALVKLRRIAAWEDRVSRLLEERTADLECGGADRAVRYRKVIALCTKVGVDDVDDLLDGLTTAMESDGPAIDLTRMAGLMQRFRKGTAGAAPA